MPGTPTDRPVESLCVNFCEAANEHICAVPDFALGDRLGSTSARRGPIDGGPLRQFNVGPGTASCRHSPAPSWGHSSVDSARVNGHSRVVLARPIVGFCRWPRMVPETD